MSADFDQKKVEGLIHDYTQARMKECTLKEDFAKVLKTQNGHVYIKVLRERILEELKLTEITTIDEFEWFKMPESGQDKILPYDVESKHNLNNLNNETAIGYNNLEERAANIERNNDIAHQSVFDKMLADYFLTKRSDYKQSN